MASVVLGVDPGLSGALAFLDEIANRVVAIYDMPLVDGPRSGEVDFLKLVALVEKHDPKIAVTEDVWGFCKNSAASSFTFGASYGCLIGAFAYMRRPLVRVRPQVWQASTFPLCELVGDYDTKAASRFCAFKLYPDAPLIRGNGRKPDHNRCDALLIARYASRLNTTGSVRIARPTDRKAGK